MNEADARRAAAADLRLLRREAKREWDEGRLACGSTQFFTKDTLSLVARIAESLYASIDGRDILKAVREVSRDPNGTPWQIRDTAQRIESTRLELEHVARKFEERDDIAAHPMNLPRLGRMP